VVIEKSVTSIKDIWDNVFINSIFDWQFFVSEFSDSK